MNLKKRAGFGLRGRTIVSLAAVMVMGLLYGRLVYRDVSPIWANSRTSNTVEMGFTADREGEYAYKIAHSLYQRGWTATFYAGQDWLYENAALSEDLQALGHRLVVGEAGKTPLKAAASAQDPAELAQRILRLKGATLAADQSTLLILEPLIQALEAAAMAETYGVAGAGGT